MRPLPVLQPPAASLFAPVPDGYGLRLGLVFGNQAPDGLCPYFAAGRCHHCDIGGGEGRAFTAEDNLARLAWFERHYASVLSEVAHLTLYNSGSTLNPVELDPDVLHRILGWAALRPRTRIVSLDSREAFIQEDAVRAAARALGRERRLHPILGLESADERIRNQVLNKRMSDPAVRRAFAAVGAVAASGWPVGLDVNVVIGGPGTTPRSVVEDAVATGEYVWTLAREADLRADLNLHPYYPSRRGRQRFSNHPRCSQPLAIRAIEALHGLRQAMSPGSHLFLGWQDEGHDQDQRLRSLELAITRSAFEAFNRTQDPREIWNLL